MFVLHRLPGQQRARFPCHPGGDGEGLPVQRLEEVFLADHPQLFPVTVVRERLHDVGACVHELTVQFLDDLRVIQHDLGDERPGLKVAPPLTLEEVTLGAHDGTLLQQFEQIRHATLRPARLWGLAARKPRAPGGAAGGAALDHTPGENQCLAADLVSHDGKGGLWPESGWWP